MRRVDSSVCGDQSNPKSYKEPIGCFFGTKGADISLVLFPFTIVDLVNIRRNVESPAVVAEVRSRNFPSGEQIGTHLPVRWAG